MSECECACVRMRAPVIRKFEAHPLLLLLLLLLLEAASSILPTYANQEIRSNGLTLAWSPGSNQPSPASRVGALGLSSRISPLRALGEQTLAAIPHTITQHDARTAWGYATRCARFAESPLRQRTSRKRGPSLSLTHTRTLAHSRTHSLSHTHTHTHTHITSGDPVSGRLRRI